MAENAKAGDVCSEKEKKTGNDDWPKSQKQYLAHSHWFQKYHVQHIDSIIVRHVGWISQLGSQIWSETRF